MGNLQVLAGLPSCGHGVADRIEFGRDIMYIVPAVIIILTLLAFYAVSKNTNKKVIKSKRFMPELILLAGLSIAFMSYLAILTNLVAFNFCS